MWAELEKKYDSLNLKGNILTQSESVKMTLNKDNEKIEAAAEKIRKSSRIILTGAGDKYLIALISKFIFRYFSEMPIEVYHSRTLLENDFKIGKNTIVIYLSQSGSTNDTISAYKKLRNKSIFSIWITNLKIDKKGSIREIKDEKSEILNTYTVYYPEKPIISTSTFQTTLALLNDLLLTAINTKESLNFKNIQKNELPPLLDKIVKNEKVIEWAKMNAVNLSKHRESTFYVIGDGIRSYVARKQALIMFMEGCKQDAAVVETEEFIHSLIETLEPENLSKNPLLVLRPYEKISNNSLLKLTDYIISLWKERAGEDKVISFSPTDFIDLNIEKDVAELLSAALYIVPLEWLTYYYAIYQKIDPGISNLVKKIRVKKV